MINVNIFLREEDIKAGLFGFCRAIDGFWICISPCSPLPPLLPPPLPSHSPPSYDPHPSTSFPRSTIPPNAPHHCRVVTLSTLTHSYGMIVVQGSPSLNMGMLWDLSLMVSPTDRHPSNHQPGHRSRPTAKPQMPKAKRTQTPPSQASPKLLFYLNIIFPLILIPVAAFAEARTVGPYSCFWILVP